MKFGVVNKIMEKNIFLNNLNNLNYIAHRLGFLMTKYPENSLEVLNEIFNNQELLESCSGFEFDICFTKDHIPVVIHDKYIDDISDSNGLINSYTLKELKNKNFNFRKSLMKNRNFKFKIVTLEEILSFFSSNKKLLNDKIIKIETKNMVTLNKKNIKIFADTLNKFPVLSDNIIHLSFYPSNLITLKKIQKSKNYSLTKSDLLCDYKAIVLLAQFFGSIDFISLRIKTKSFPKINNKNSRRVNKKIFLDNFFMRFSNALNDKVIRNAIKKYGSVGVYVLNNENDINEFCRKINTDTFINYHARIYFTTDNPNYFKNMTN